MPGQPQVIETVAYFNESDTFYTSLEIKKGGLTLLCLTGSKDYKGPGLAGYEQQIEGPLYDSWPPPSTMNLVADVQDFDKREFEGDEAVENVRRTLRRLAPQIFRRPVGDDELQPFIGLVVEQQNQCRRSPCHR